MRIVPLLRASEVRALRGRIRAYRGLWPIPRVPTLAQVDWPDAPLPFDEYRANASDEAEGAKLKAPAVEPVSRAAAGRSAAATSEPMDVTAGETAPEFEMPAAGNATADDGGGCEARTAEVTIGAAAGDVRCSPENVRERHVREGRAEPSGRVEAGARAPASSGEKPKVDYGRVADAFRNQPRPVERKTRALEPALSREGCARCGIPGWRGCDHQLPYEEAPRGQ